MRQVPNVILEPDPLKRAEVERALVREGLTVVVTATAVDFLSHLLQSAPTATAILGGGVGPPERQILLNAIRSMPSLSGVLVIRLRPVTAIFVGQGQPDRSSMDRVLHAMQAVES